MLKRMTFLCIALGKEVDQAIKEGNKALLGTLKELSLKKRNRLQFLNYVCIGRMTIWVRLSCIMGVLTKKYSHLSHPVCRPDETNGRVHKYELDMEGLKVLDFQKYSILSWLAELMKHRDAADSKRYRMLSQKFIAKYGIETSGYDVIKGWRADASYFYIAKAFVRDEIDVEILEELLLLGGLGIQYCIKSELAYSRLSERKEELISVEYDEFNEKYNERDVTARKRMKELIDSDANKVTNVFSTLL